MTRLMHYSREPFTFDPIHEYEPQPAGVFTKPSGFWVSAPGEDDWPAFCRENMPPGRVAHAYEVTIAGTANILTLRAPEELDEFTEAFGFVGEFEARMGARWPRARPSRSIDWQVVASKYDGILIPIYQWSRRNELDWYYTWDCASGCIWNLNVLSVRPETLVVRDA